MKHPFTNAVAIGFAFCGLAAAQSPNYMREDCANASQIFFQDFEAQSDTKYEGQRTDGMHAVNGTIYLENRSENFQCSYNRSGDTMVDFYTEGQSWQRFVQGGGSPYMGDSGTADDGDGAMAGSAPIQDEVRVRFSPGTTGATYSAALNSGDAVRYVLGARNEQFLTVELRGNSQYLNYIIYVPGGDILFESSQAGYRYYGQLYKSGDHVVDVFYNGNQGTTGSYEISFQIK